MIQTILMNIMALCTCIVLLCITAAAVILTVQLIKHLLED